MRLTEGTHLADQANALHDKQAVAQKADELTNNQKVYLRPSPTRLYQQ